MGRPEVERWNDVVHFQDAARHAWILEALDALEREVPLPPTGRGTAFARHATADSRVLTIRRLLAWPDYPPPAPPDPTLFDEEEQWD